jgi:S-adenosylmethionine:tRNA ribosyltransferase-isomerase
MDVSLFDFELPSSAIAQTPSERRDASRLMVVNRRLRSWSHHTFNELPQFLPPDCQIYRNAVSVLKARLYGRRPTGGEVECLLLRPADSQNEWWCLLKPGRRLPVGARFSLSVGEAEVRAKCESGEAKVLFHLPPDVSVTDLSARYGVMPLPPYISRSKTDERHALDAERYQTVYANPAQQKAVAAPTAGLHFTPDLIDSMKQQGHAFHDLFLHVGAGTFKPIQTTNIKDHAMHGEEYLIPSSARIALHEGKRSGQTQLGIGTTAMRAIEDYWRKTQLTGHSVSDADYLDEAKLFIYPPADFFLDGLLTNFHLPRSTLLCLVSAFLTPDSEDGIQWLKELYADALSRNYRFFSYGDAMLIL